MREQAGSRLSRGGDLWRLLASITKHKLLRQARHHGADRRSVDLEVPLDGAEDECYLVRGREPTPDDALALGDEVEWILSRLDSFGKRVMELRLQGRNSRRSPRTPGGRNARVRRTLDHIRELLAKRLDDA